jgi:cytochrome b
MAGEAQDTRPVWDRLVRVLHWSLALSVLLAWLSSEGWAQWHEWVGYVSLACIALRVAWGFCGPRHARFVDFVHSPATTLGYARQVAEGREPRYVGHNPLGGWMILALLLVAMLTGLSGWLYTTDAFWGVEWVEEVHEALAEALLVLIAVHVAGVLFSSRRHRENLAAAMLHGRKRPAASGDID